MPHAAKPPPIIQSPRHADVHDFARSGAKDTQGSMNLEVQNCAKIGSPLLGQVSNFLTARGYARKFDRSTGVELSDGERLRQEVRRSKFMLP